MVTTPPDRDPHEATRRLLVGLAAEQDLHELSGSLAVLHPARDTFPGEVFLHLGAQVLSDVAAAGVGPIAYEGLRERDLGEIRLRGKANRKFQYAALCAAAVAGGLEPDLLDEVTWWGTDDFWHYALLAAVALIRASADQRGIAIEQVVAELAERHGIDLAAPPANV